MYFLIIETYKPGKAPDIYQRARNRGRLMPDGLEYVTSWVTEDMRSCYQVVASERPELIDEWIANWSDLVEFEVIPVLTSEEASEKALDGTS